MKLHHLINPKLSEEIVKNSVLIEEKKNIEQSTLKSVRIANLPKESVLVTLDKEINNKQFSNNWLSNEKYINKSCDAVVISYEDNEIDLLFCELKSKSPSGYEAQLVNTKLFFDYLINLYNCFFEGKIKIRKTKFVLFFHQRMTLQSKTIYRENMSDKYSSFEIVKYPCHSTQQQAITWITLLS